MDVTGTVFSLPKALIKGPQGPTQPTTPLNNLLHKQSCVNVDTANLPPSMNTMNILSLVPTLKHKADYWYLPLDHGQASQIGQDPVLLTLATL